MATGKVKLFATTTAFFAFSAIILFTLSIAAIGKFTAQKKRVHHMELQILAGKAEILKVPTMIANLRVANKENNELQMEVAELTEASEEFDGELADLQKELTLMTVAKLVLEVDKAGYTKNLIEARQAVTELREEMGTNDGGTRIDELDEIEKTLIESSH